MQSPTPFARIGTRGSPLALAQAELVRDLLSEIHDVARDRIEIEVFSTGGDRSQKENTTLSDIGGKGVFTKEIDEALLSGRIDIGVHSSKDVATALPAGIHLAAFLEREDARDAFISVSVKGIDNLPEGARFGTSSIRRAAQAWIDSLPPMDAAMAIDLAKIEQIHGCWSGAEAYGHPLPFPTLNPFSGQRLNEITLAMPKDYRQSNRMFPVLLRALWPELLDVPINRATGLARLRFWRAEITRMIPANLRRKLKPLR